MKRIIIALTLLTLLATACMGIFNSQTVTPAPVTPVEPLMPSVDTAETTTDTVTDTPSAVEPMGPAELPDDLVPNDQ